MSSSRSLASARNKRANTASSIPTGIAATTTAVISSVSAHQEKSIASTQFPSGKMTVPQVINIISDRVNTLELFMETTANVIDDIQEFHTKITDKYVVDSEVFNSIISRIDALEGKGVTANQNPVNPVAPMRVTQDIDELKIHLIRLQTYVMETNAKMQDLIFSNTDTSILSFGEVFSESTNGQRPFATDQVPTPPTLVRSMTAIMNIDAISSPIASESIIPIDHGGSIKPRPIPEVHFSNVNVNDSGSEDGEVSGILEGR